MANFDLLLVAGRREYDVHIEEGNPMLLTNVSHLDTLQPRAQVALRNSPVCELRDVDVVRRDGALVISGVVSSFYHKQLAQEVVRAVCRDCEVELVNQIRVR
jgi:hypothetical protein